MPVVGLGHLLGAVSGEVAYYCLLIKEWMLAFVRLYLISQIWILATLFFFIVKGVPRFNGWFLKASPITVYEKPILLVRPSAMGVVGGIIGYSSELTLRGFGLALTPDIWRSATLRKSIIIDPPSTSRIVSGCPIRVTGEQINSEWNLYVVDCRWMVSLDFAKFIRFWSHYPFYSLTLSLLSSA